MMITMRLLGIDYGEKRVGLALTDPTGRFALPYQVVANTSQLIGTIAEICTEQKVTLIILGESKDWQGKNNPIMKRVRAFKKKLETLAGLRVVFEPEFLTSVAAEREQGKTASLDASAAALILKSYLDRQK